MTRRRTARWVTALVAAAALAFGLLGAAGTHDSAKGSANPAAGINKIQHVVMIIQENRSFDSYFGTYPGADGIPMQNGVPTVCAPDPKTGTCVKPYHDPSLKNHGGPHGHAGAVMDIDGGRMDGFMKSARLRPPCGGGCQPDVMGYHDQREIPNYWAYAQHYVLQDHMFEAVGSWTLPEHNYLVSAWNAICSRRDDPMSCKASFGAQNPDSDSNVNYAWTDITYLLAHNGVSWRYYIQTGQEPDCPTGDDPCPPKFQNAATPGHYNPLPYYTTVRQDGQLGNITTVDDFLSAAQNGTLPNVSWVIPSKQTSDHPPANIGDGQAYVTRLINAVMQGPDWDSTAIFLQWDDWGGFYDHVVPPAADKFGYGLRVASLMISPWAKPGYIDHQTLSSDAYLKFIEDRFLGGQRIDPRTDGRPDPRKGVREANPILGDLSSEFDFNQTPLPPLVLPLRP